MPDWRQNQLVVSGDPIRLEQFKTLADSRNESAANEEEDQILRPSVLSFHNLVPVPAEVAILPYGAPGGAYVWQKQHWGVKWGACYANLTEEGDALIYDFETAWVEPTSFVDAISNNFPNLSFHLESACNG